MKRRRGRMIKIVAGLTALAALMVCMIGTLLVVRVVSGIPLSDKGPSWEAWWLVLGGGIGAGAGSALHYLILRKFGKFTDREIEKNWRGR